MKIEASSPSESMDNLPEERQAPVQKLRQTVKNNLPGGFEETMSYDMIGYVVPHSIYPQGYHCDTKLPLPFLSLASQKNYIALYHSGIYVDNELSAWFVDEFKKRTGKKPDMGKSCIRFKNIQEIPYDLIAELVAKMTPQEWIKIYESKIKR